MKPLLVLSPLLALGLTACDTMNAPLSNSGFDPLMTPGSGYRTTDSRPAFKAGDLARAIMDNTFFFKQLPKGEADADKTLLRGTGMKVIRVAGSYLQVELDVTGEVGYVPAVMVENTSAQPPPTPPLPGEVPAYPLAPGIGPDGNPLPTIDPTAQPPDGAIPTVIDPTLPADPNLPTGEVPTGVPPVPPTPPVAPPTPPVPAPTPEAAPPTPEAPPVPEPAAEP
jgi:hypothetical protein